MANPDETDLVDASELPSEEDVTEARHKVGEDDAPEPSATERDSGDDAEAEDPFAMQMESAKPGQTTIASLRERLAAFLVDCGVLWLLFWGGLFVFHKVTTHNWLGPVPTMGTMALFFHGIFLLLAFLYFFLLEASFFATIGKFCCWMYVRRKDGRHAGAFSIFIRNFFRMIELLTGGLLTWVPMELSRRHQRLGDMAAGTIVIKRHSANPQYYPIDADHLASAFGRSFAQIIDLALVLIWLVGYVMLINYQATILSQWLVLLFPIVFILFWTLVQVTLETTPGLWLIGYTITHEDGGRLTFAGALLRVLLAPVDLVMGLPCMLLSLRKQKIGDLLAATLVSRQHRRWKGAIGSLVVVAVTISIVAAGLFINPTNNIFRASMSDSSQPGSKSVTINPLTSGNFKLTFLPTLEGLPDWESVSSATPQILTVRNFRFGVNDLNTLRTPPVYVPGETVYLLSEISGYTRKDRMVWIQEDLMVQYPDGTIGLKQENAVDYHQIWDPGVMLIKLNNNFPLPPTAAPGTYVVTVTLRDMLANKFTVTEIQSFTVKAPPSMTSPLEAVPPAPPTPSPLPVEPSGAPQPPPPPLGEGTPPPASTVPSSPIPVTPVPAGVQDTGGTPPPTAAPAPSTAPAGGFTVLPGPSIEPKQETVPVPTIPIPPPSAIPPADQYGTKPIAPITPVPVPTSPSMAPVPTQPTSTPVPPPVTAQTPPTTVAPQPATPAIVEKTLTPTDAYGKPVTPAVSAPADVPIAPATAPVKEPAKPATKEKTKAAPVPKEAKPTPPKPATSTTKSAPDEDLKKAAEKELQKIAPTPATPPAKPAADIPSASAVKSQAEQLPAAPKKKKKASSGSGSSGGYMP